MTRYDAIFRRKSIRKYKWEELDPGLLDTIEKFGTDEGQLYPDTRIKWRIFRDTDRNLKGLFQVKAPYYAVLYSELKEECLVNAGFLMEQLSLYLHTKGIGSCYQGGAALRHTDETELCPVMIMAFGRPAEPLERSREDFRRMELKKLVKIHGSFGKIQRKLLEAARVAPSAMNLQPWRFVVTENRVHLFVGKPPRIGYQFRKTMNLFGAGIALSHMLITAEELWFDVEYRRLDSILEKDFQNYIYVGSLLILDESEKC